jgi:hypothetical protein
LWRAGLKSAAAAHHLLRHPVCFLLIGIAGNIDRELCLESPDRPVNSWHLGKVMSKVTSFAQWLMAGLYQTMA